MKIGFGETVITPPVGSSLHGYFHDRRSTGIRDNLLARAVLFQQAETVVALVACDLIWVTAETTETIRKWLRQELKVPVTHLLLHATHTHTGPLTAPPTPAVYERGFWVHPGYLKVLPALIAGSVKIAWETRETMALGIGQAKASGISFNRRYLLDDGRVVTNPRPDRQKIVRSAGPVDDTVGIIKITSPDGKLKGLLLNFACHPDTLGGTLISADWPGLVRKRLESRFPGLQTILFNGPSGDINHLNPFDRETRSPAVGERISQTIEEVVIPVLERIETHQIDQVQAVSQKISLPYRMITPEEQEQARQCLRKRLPADSLQKLIATQTLQRCRERAIRKSIPVECLALALEKEVAIVGLPGEVFTQLGLDIKAGSGFPYTWVVQNCNTALGYVPSPLAFQQHRQNQKIKPEYDTTSLTEALGINCSYETTPLACRVDERAAQKLVDNSLQLLKKISRLLT
ncbi:MAG TPA: neutral/alkaline non-lysosomal ceramidase N-terminal domain-containing protein [bacterium]|nr:neutral/alkaline non-lysosomal ceramidase N-terminal domain-containing protein [bacterium]